MSVPSPTDPTGWQVTTQSADETRRLGERLGQAAQPRTVIGLSGNLGAGKTHFTQGIACGLGVDRRLVSSPTFSLIQEYAGRLPVFHFDTYRVKTLDEFLDLGFDEYLSLPGVCVIEWADRVLEVLPADCLFISISSQGETTRQFDWRAGGPCSEQVLASVRQLHDGAS